MRTRKKMGWVQDASLLFDVLLDYGAECSILVSCKCQRSTDAMLAFCCCLNEILRRPSLSRDIYLFFVGVLNRIGLKSAVCMSGCLRAASDILFQLQILMVSVTLNTGRGWDHTQETVVVTEMYSISWLVASPRISR